MIMKDKPVTFQIDSGSTINILPRKYLSEEDNMTESSKLTTFATPFGMYRWTRLPFGLKTSSEIFQRKLMTAIADLEGVICVADDIVVHAENDEVHDQRLKNLLQRCREVGIRLNKEKSQLRTNEMIYLGHKITSNGVEPDPQKIQAITNMPAPTNKAEVRTFQGTVTYLAKFLPHLSTIMEPIRSLLKDDADFMWSSAQENAFEEIKRMISNAPILAYYDSKKELIVQCDASNKGLGACLLQEGKPLAYASRALTSAEQNYAPIEKEMKAVVWSLQRFHQYTYARKVIVHSDHQPLVSITNKPLNRAPQRLQNMLLRCQTYNYTIVWQPGKKQVIADALSRAMLDTEVEKEDVEDVHNLSMYIPLCDDQLQNLKTETGKDEILCELKKVIVSGWPERDKLDIRLTPYHSYADELSVHDGVCLKGERIVIPASMRKSMLQEIHTAHLGVSGCTRRARETLFWPKMAYDIKSYIETCETCRRYEISEPKQPLMPHNLPERPWEKIGVDLFQIQNDHYLITVDYFSNFWEIDKLENQETQTIIKKLKMHFARYGYPCELVSDNGPNLTSEKIRKFFRKYNINHFTSSPENHKANGMAESAVKTAKRIIIKCKESHTDVYSAILSHRNTPTQGLDTSPAQRMFGRRTRTTLPTTATLLNPKNLQTEDKKRRKENQEKQAMYYNMKTRDLKPLEEGETVRMKPFRLNDKVWKKAVVQKRLDERSYELLTENGNITRKNREHLRPSKEPPPEFNNAAVPRPAVPKPAVSKPVVPKPAVPNQETESKETETEKPTTKTMMKKSSHTEEKPVDDPKKPEKKIKKPDGSPKKQVRPQEKPKPESSPQVQRTRSGRTIKKPERYQ